MITVITGSMKSGKSDYIINLIEELKQKNISPKVFYPKILEKESGYIVSRTGKKHKAIPLTDPINIYSFIGNSKYIIIDEFQFIDNLNTENKLDFLRFVDYCIDNDINLYLAGLDLDYRSHGFEIVKECLSIADRVEKLLSTCDYCGKNNGRRCVKYIDGKIAEFSEEILEMESENVIYKSACAKCFNEKTRKNKK